MEYPFKFKELLLTDKVLDVLGFSEYWAGSGDFGERSFGIQGVDLYRIVEIDESDDPECGYGYGKPEYCSKHFVAPFKNKDGLNNLYFLHELYDNISINNPSLLEMFITKCKENNMYPYIESYLNYTE